MNQHSELPIDHHPLSNRIRWGVSCTHYFNTIRLSHIIIFNHYSIENMLNWNPISFSITIGRPLCNSWQWVRCILRLKETLKMHMKCKEMDFLNNKKCTIFISIYLPYIYVYTAHNSFIQVCSHSSIHSFIFIRWYIINTYCLYINVFFLYSHIFLSSFSILLWWNEYVDIDIGYIHIYRECIKNNLTRIQPNIIIIILNHLKVSRRVIDESLHTRARQTTFYRM